jgi:imidazolonepropionase-like amidohydrolase
MKILFSMLFASVLMATGFATASEEDKPVQILFTNVNIFDGKSEALDMNTNVLIEGNLIKKIGPSIPMPTGAEVIDGGGRNTATGLY